MKIAGILRIQGGLGPGANSESRKALVIPSIAQMRYLKLTRSLKKYTMHLPPSSDVIFIGESAAAVVQYFNNQYLVAQWYCQWNTPTLSSYCLFEHSCVLVSLFLYLKTTRLIAIFFAIFQKFWRCSAYQKCFGNMMTQLVTLGLEISRRILGEHRYIGDVIEYLAKEMQRNSYLSIIASKWNELA